MRACSHFLLALPAQARKTQHRVEYPLFSLLRKPCNERPISLVQRAVRDKLASTAHFKKRREQQHIRVVLGVVTTDEDDVTCLEPVARSVPDAIHFNVGEVCPAAAEENGKSQRHPLRPCQSERGRTDFFRYCQRRGCCCREKGAYNKKYHSLRGFSHYLLRLLLGLALYISDNAPLYHCRYRTLSGLMSIT